ncbi:hypothetical protein OTK49_21265 [Vibrio coralliirubri]|uniref:hypothetical protein n=1 Tax=Vibrio coralliirubri TaxID=1516159 RepID=UPI002284223E|nr:hypothetical protein [Vibrio coralliirubri]MCY9865051.1 hypothetical protein [Vibrio coralliirubri]
MSNFLPVEFISEHCEVMNITESTVIYSEVINTTYNIDNIGWMPDSAGIHGTIKRVTMLVSHTDGAETYIIYNAGFELKIGDKIALLFATSDNVKNMQLVGLRNFTRCTQTRFTNFDTFYSTFHPRAKREADEERDKGNQIGWAIASVLCFLWIQSEEPLGNWWLNTGALFLMIGQMVLFSALGGYFFRTPIAWIVTKLLSSGQKDLIEREYRQLKDTIHQQLDDIPAFKVDAK